MARRTLSITVSADDEARLRLLAARTDRTVDACLHEALALLLERYREHLPEQLTWSAVDAGATATGDR
ncbi:MAG: ribbon-helix-helix domain-containing protein [Kofleriaceae bacterium]